MVKKFMRWLCQLPARLLRPHEDGLEQWKRIEFNKPTPNSNERGSQALWHNFFTTRSYSRNSRIWHRFVEDGYFRPPRFKDAARRSDFRKSLVGGT